MLCNGSVVSVKVISTKDLTGLLNKVQIFFENIVKNGRKIKFLRLLVLLGNIYTQQVILNLMSLETHIWNYCKVKATMITELLCLKETYFQYLSLPLSKS